MFNLLIAGLFAIEVYVLYNWKTSGRIYAALHNKVTRDKLKDTDSLIGLSQIVLWSLPMLLFAIVTAVIGRGQEQTFGLVLLGSFVIYPILGELLKFNGRFVVLIKQVTRLSIFTWYLLTAKGMI